MNAYVFWIIASWIIFVGALPFFLVATGVLVAFYAYGIGMFSALVISAIIIRSES